MKRTVVFMIVLAAAAVPGYSQGSSSGTVAVEPAAPPAQASAATADKAKETAVLTDLDKKEAEEIRLLQDKIDGARKRMAEETKRYQDQITAVREKYRAEKYAAMDRLTPGSGTRLAKRDKALGDLEAQLRKDLNVINTAQSAEAAKGTMTKEKQDKFQADRKLVITGYNAKRKEILSK